MNIPEPIFKKNLSTISWKKIYDREYGVQYSEVAISLLANAHYHFPKTSVAQIVIPGVRQNTSFFIDGLSWITLVEGLNKKYTSNIKNLQNYEKQFLFDGNEYLALAKKINATDLKTFSDNELLSLFLDHQEKRNRYSVFAWSAFILNNYIADRATTILDAYIIKQKRESEKDNFHNALFRPEKNAAVLQLQYEVEKYNGKLPKEQFDKLYEQYKWLSCLDIQNKPWTKEEFTSHIKSFTQSARKKSIPFTTVVKELHINKKDVDYLLMAKRFVYIKDARDDFRRESVFYSRKLFEELGKRMGIPADDVTYVQEQEIVNFLANGKLLDKQLINQRKKGFVVYLDAKKQLVCLEGDTIQKALSYFKLQKENEKAKELTGRVASQGKAKGVVAIVHGVRDLSKVKTGNILVAVTTHPDYVSAMRKAAAIVTDEGGITSHAAIVSREFGIPCIVGCKNATKFLRDGDFVEVNAENGKIIQV